MATSPCDSQYPSQAHMLLDRHAPVIKVVYIYFVPKGKQFFIRPCYLNILSLLGWVNVYIIYCIFVKLEITISIQSGRNYQRWLE